MNVLLRLKDLAGHAPDLPLGPLCRRPDLAQLVQCADIQPQQLTQVVVVVLDEVKGPFAEVDYGGEGEDAGEEVSVGCEGGDRKGDEVGDGGRGGESVTGMGVVRLVADGDGLMRCAGRDGLGWGGVELGVRLVEEDGRGVTHHVSLEEHLINTTLAVQGMTLGLRKVQRPVREEGLDASHVGIGGVVDGRCAHKLAEVADAKDTI